MRGIEAPESVSHLMMWAVFRPILPKYSTTFRLLTLVTRIAGT